MYCNLFLLQSQEAAREFTAECNDDIILMTCLHINRKTSKLFIFLEYTYYEPQSVEQFALRNMCTKNIQ